MRARKPAATAKPLPALERDTNAVQMAPWWPVFAAGTLHGPVYDEKGRRKNKPEAPIGWLGVDGQVQPDRPEQMSTQGLIVA